MLLKGRSPACLARAVSLVAAFLVGINMAKARYIHTKFWSDDWISRLDPVEKLLFIYLLTNERTNICGVYELPLKFMAVETGIEKDMVEKILIMKNFLVFLEPYKYRFTLRTSKNIRIYRTKR